VITCSQTWDENRTADHWRNFKIWLWKRRARKMDMAAELAKFQAYLNGPSSPVTEPATTSDPVRPPGAPWLLRVRQFLQSKLGMSYSEAMDFPFAAAAWEYAAFYESEGGLKIQNDEDRDFLSWVDEQEEKRKGAMNG
jgi:hypothetical protein